MIDTKMTLDVQKNGVQRTVYIKEGETAGARRIIITLTNNGKVVGVVGKVVTCYIKTPTATRLVTDATSVDEDTNTVVFAIPTLDEGSYFLELVIQDASANQIYSPTFEIIAEKALYSSADLGELEQNTAYIIVTDDTFYTKDDVDDLLEDYATKAELDGKIDAPDDAEDKQVLTYDATTEKWIAADGGSDGGLVIELTATETSGRWTTDTEFDEIDAAATSGKPITITYVDIVGGEELTRYRPVYGWYLAYNASIERYKYEMYCAEGNGYYKFTFRTSGNPHMPTVLGEYVSTALPSIDSTPTQNSNNLVKSGGVYTAINTAVSGKENTSNKVTSISDSSTDTQYPSAKCVYDAIQASGGSEPDFVVTATGDDFLKGEMNGGLSVTLATSKTLTELLAKAAAHEELDVKGTIYVEDSDPDYAEEGVFDVQKYDLWYYRYGTADYINYLLGELSSEDTTERPGIALVFQHTFPRGSNKNVCFDRYAAWAIIVYESESTPGTISYEYTDDLANLL